MRKKTKKNPRGAGRKPKFKAEYGKLKRISVSVPASKKAEIVAKIDDVLLPYRYLD